MTTTDKLLDNLMKDYKKTITGEIGSLELTTPRD